MENYTIYKFTFSDGKTYIGQTSRPVEERWQKGEGYKGQEVYVPIILEGWDNIKKEILHTNLTSYQANKLENYYIKKFNSINNGYNKVLPKMDKEVNKNIGGSPLTLIAEKISEQDKIKCQKYILKTLTGRDGNLLKMMWFFILNDNTQFVLKKKIITEELDMKIAKYYEARKKLIDLKWLEIKDSFLIIKYNNILIEEKSYKKT